MQPWRSSFSRKNCFVAVRRRKLPELWGGLEQLRSLNGCGKDSCSFLLYLVLLTGLAHKAL